MSATRRNFLITCVRREQGYWTAHVCLDGSSTPVHRKYGSWMIRATDRVEREVLPDVAAALQARVRPLERAARKEAA